MARFKNEARAAGRLHHPNIVGIYEYGEEESVAFIAMEYVNGIGLREYLERKVNFEFGQLVNIMSQLLQALEFAHDTRRRPSRHQAGQPDHDGQTGELKVADFGIARIDTSELTMDGTVLGTPAYMSPEQCIGRPSDHRSDLFSAAVVFYELLAGQKPFVGSVETLTYQICQVEPRPPSQVAPAAAARVHRRAVRQGARQIAGRAIPAARASSARRWARRWSPPTSGGRVVGADGAQPADHSAAASTQRRPGTTWF